MTKLDIDKKLENRVGKRPNKAIYQILRVVIGKHFVKKMKLEVIDNVGTKNIKEPFILVANHTSRCDWIYVTHAFRTHALNFMASHTEFHRAHMHFIFDLMHLIPKKNFTADVHAIKELKQVAKKGGSIMFFPEGKSSISGTNQPVMIGTGKLLKHMKMPVYSITITGGYMSNTQWYIQDRPGKVIATVNKLFDIEDLTSLTPEEIEDKVNVAIYNDDFAWNEKARVKFEGNENIATKLEEHIFFCPKCGKELTMKGEGNRFYCTECGNGTAIDEYYDFKPFDKDCVIPKNLRVWYELQRRKIYREIKAKDNFTLTEKVKLGIQPSDHYVDKHITAEVVGEGMLTLNKKEFSFVGTKDGKPFELHKDIINMPTLLLETDSSYFGSFIDGTYYEFTPERPVTTKWLLAVEECHRLAGGKWQNTIRQQQWIYEDDKETDKENYYL